MTEWRGGATAYALATGMTAAASVGGVILLTRLLTAEGYGLYAAIVGLVMIVQNASYLAVQTSIIRFHARAADPEARHRLATAVRIAFLLVTALVAVVWMAAVRWLGQAGVTMELAVAGLLLLILRGWLSLVQAWNRAEGRAWKFFLLEAVQAFGALILMLAALHLAPRKPEIAIWSTAAAYAVAASLSPTLIVARIRTQQMRALLQDLINYGAPLSLVFLAGAALAVSDRLIIAVQLGAAAAGAYAVAFAISDRAINLVMLPVPIANKPELFAAWERSGEAAARSVMERTAYWLIVLGFPATAILVFASEPITRLVAGEGLAQSAARMVPWLAIGSLLSALLTHHFALAFQLTRRTRWMLVAVGVPAVLNVGANLILVPRFGMIAAGWTTVGGYSLALCLAILIGRRQVSIPFCAQVAWKCALCCVPLCFLLSLASR